MSRSLDANRHSSDERNRSGVTEFRSSLQQTNRQKEHSGGHPENESRHDPEHEALMADSVGVALLVVLDRLTPSERLAFVLHDMFAVSFDEIAPMIGRSPAAARQLASRARRRVQGKAERPVADLSQRQEIV